MGEKPFAVAGGASEGEEAHAGRGRKKSKPMPMPAMPASPEAVMNPIRQAEKGGAYEEDDERQRPRAP